MRTMTASFRSRSSRRSTNGNRLPRQGTGEVVLQVDDRVEVDGRADPAIRVDLVAGSVDLVWAGRHVPERLCRRFCKTDWSSPNSKRRRSPRCRQRSTPSWPKFSPKSKNNNSTTCRIMIVAPLAVPVDSARQVEAPAVADRGVPAHAEAVDLDVPQKVARRS